MDRMVGTAPEGARRRVRRGAAGHPAAPGRPQAGTGQQPTQQPMPFALKVAALRMLIELVAASSDHRQAAA